MKVAVYYSNDDVRIEERPAPLISGGELLVRMMASGICGTDVMQWYRQQKGPRVLGHEMAGEIVDVGSNVERFKIGDRVFVSHHVPCFRCSYCTEGNYTACESLHAGNYDPGGFSEYIRVPEQNVRYGTFLLPDRLPYEEATMIEPLACVVAGQSEIGLKESHVLLVIGCGVSGLLHIQMAKSAGATVVATDLNDFRLDRARELGADYVFPADDFSGDKLRAINRERLAERVIVCAGVPEAVQSAITSVDRRGKILFFAVPKEDIPLPSLRFWRDEITVAFSYGAAPADLQRALDLITSGAVNVRKMITHGVPLSEIQAAFRLVTEAGESLKVIVVPDNSFR
ncbi:MAG TPA: alcohol dehydrogenase catalytic domain-containing protein [Thermodesulfovibrionales bacterium]|nr:alcohol dehydrogenase catalytic domain-containing protein [Thermodesulfovibrionales bacterium]